MLWTKSGPAGLLPGLRHGSPVGLANSQFGARAARPAPSIFFISPRDRGQLLRPEHRQQGAGNPLVRQAINYAIDRTGMTKQLGYKAGIPTDKYLPPQVAGCMHREERLPAHSPDLSKATGADGAGQGGGRDHADQRARLLDQGCQSCTNRMALLTQELKPLGINVKVKYFQRSVQFQEEGVKGTPNDIADEGWLADFPDPYDFLNILLSGHSILPRTATTSRTSTIRRSTSQLDAAAPTTARPALGVRQHRNRRWRRPRRRGRPGPTRPTTTSSVPLWDAQLCQPTYGMDYGNLCLQH